MKVIQAHHLNGCHVDFQFLLGGDHAFLLAQVKFMLQCANVSVQKSIIFVL